MTVSTDSTIAFWADPVDDVLSQLSSSESGLTAEEAEGRLASFGPNSLAPTRGRRGFRLLVSQFESPIVVILIGATLVAAALGDLTDSLIILAIVVASGLLGFWQEHTAGRAVDALVAQVRATARVLRDGGEQEIPAEQVVPGDIVLLAPGSMVPADCRVLSSNSLLVDEAALTGESYPRAKSVKPVAPAAAPSERSSALFMGTHVLSGSGTAIVVLTGARSEFGELSISVAERPVVTSFERGTTRFGLLLVRVMVVLVTAVFLVNLALHRPPIDSVLFALALAVGITPQLLPAIVAVSLSKGAKMMAAEKVIVRRLDAIEDFGSMTTLCTDKTGTITEGTVRLDAALDLMGQPSPGVLRLALLNACLQRGFPNPLDLAISAGGPPDPSVRLLGEVPYDFTRKRLSVLVGDEEGPMLITKGAVASTFSASSHAEIEGRTIDIETARTDVERLVEELTGRGLRVLGVATRRLQGRDSASVDDERDMVLQGVLTFADPPKLTAAEAIEDLLSLGVRVCVVTGDSLLAARHTAKIVGLPVDSVLNGANIDATSDADLPAAIRDVRVFAEVEPLHKERIVRALQSIGETVGFLGDGVNDAPALHAADVGISVDTAVDVAKQTAAMVLLDKSLDVVADGIRLGRQTFANTLKYIRVTISANFGNVLSMAAASVVLPFLPLLPRQILLLNFMSDIPATTISTDTVDPEQITKPVRWDLHAIRDFMIVFGLVSSAFDILTFVVLRLGFHAGAELFRSGWFVESTATELAVMLVLRTDRLFFRSRPSTPLLVSSIAIFVVTVALPYSPLAAPLGLVALPMELLAALAMLIGLYVLTNEVVKQRFLSAVGTRVGRTTA